MAFGFALTMLPPAVASWRDQIERLSKHAARPAPSPFSSMKMMPAVSGSLTAAA
jgi:hypothetical protein